MRIKIGFGRDFFIIGSFAFLLRGMLKEFCLVTLIISLFSFSMEYFFEFDSLSSTAASTGVVLGMYGNLYQTYLMHKKGWVLKKPSEKTWQYAAADWKKLYFGNKNKMTAEQYLDKLMRPYSGQER